MYKHYKTATAAAFAAMSIFTSASAQYNIKSATPRYEVPASAHEGEDYMSKTIIFKVKPTYRSLCSANDINHSQLKALMLQMGVQNFGKIYPREEQPVRPYNQYGQKLVDLSLMYEYTYTSNTPLQQVLDKIASLDIFEYAEMHVIPKASYTVSDPSVGSQYHIAKISAPQAWDISKGDTNIVIGITDTGTEPTHADLKNNIKHNYQDKIDGIDNDGDGFKDNFSGWDLGMNDNDPTFQVDAHGVHVSGIAAASTDNGVGVAGTGFKCKFLPIKIADATGKLVASYTGIQYAASHGCKVINCSWGSQYWSQYGQDIVNAATFNSDAIVVAAAGNNGDGTKSAGDETLNYPGYYQNVLSVAATTSSDKLATFSNFNYLVKISAPGNAIYSTYSGGSYANLSGTSMATPCTAGAIAIVRSYFPAYSALQAAARLCVTADNIVGSGLPNSTLYNNKLGSGRVNLYRALNDPATPSVLMTTKTITDGNDNAPVALDTLRIAGIYTNYLAPTTNLTATISVLTSAGFVTLVPGTTVANLGAIGTMATGNNAAAPFKVIIKGTAPLNTSVIFKITYADGTYKSSETFEVVVNVDYLNVTVNNVFSSITSKGRDGWNNNPPTQGLGFKYKGANLLYDGSFIIGIPDSAVSDMARGIPVGGDADFKSNVNIRRITTGALSDFDTEGYMNDSAALQPLWVSIHHKSYAWAAAADSKYIMYKYIVRNKGNATLSNMYAGIIADWDIQGVGGDSNRVAYDATNRMGYTWYTKANGLYGGIKLLSKVAPANTYAFDNIDTSTGINPNSTSGFTNKKKYIALSTMRTDAGYVHTPGNDVMNVVSTGPLTLNPGDSVEVALALIAGDNLADLKTSAINAQARYDNMTTAIPSIKIAEGFTLRSYPNPSSGITTIDITMAQSGRMELKLYNMIGQDITTIATGDYSSGSHRFNLDVSKLNSGVYYYQLVCGDTKLVQKLMVSK
jgi:serine protease